MYAPKLVYTKMVPETRTQFGVPFTTSVPSPSLLLHFAGADTSTTFIDSSDLTHVPIVNGTAQIDNAQSFFGGTSGLFTASASSSLRYTDDDGSLAFRTGDYTVDCLVRFASVGASAQFWVFSPGAEVITVGKAANDRLAVACVGVGNLIVGPTVLVANTWYHVAVTRFNTLTTMFLNGAIEGPPAIDTNDYEDSTNGDFYVGQGSTSFMDGWIDEFRVVKGLAAWTAPFTPPSAPYTP